MFDHTHRTHTNPPKPYSNPFDPFNLHDPNDFYHNIPRGYRSPRANPAIIFAKPHIPTPELQAKKQAYETAEREAILANHKLMQAINAQAGTAGPTRDQFLAIKEHQEATRAHANALKEQLPPEPPQEPAELPVPYDHRPRRKYLRYEDIPVVTPENAGIPLHKLFPHFYPAPSEPCVVTETTDTTPHPQTTTSATQNPTDPRGGVREHASPTTNDHETSTTPIGGDHARGEQITQADAHHVPSLHAEPSSQHPNQHNEGVVEGACTPRDARTGAEPGIQSSINPTSSLDAEPVSQHPNQPNEGVVESACAQCADGDAHTPHPSHPHSSTSFLDAEPASQHLNQPNEGVVESESAQFPRSHDTPSTNNSTHLQIPPTSSLHAEPLSQHPNQRNDGVTPSACTQPNIESILETDSRLPMTPTSSLHAEPAMQHVNQRNEGVVESSIAQPHHYTDPQTTTPHPTTTPPTHHTPTPNHHSSLLPAEPASQDPNQGTEGVVGSTPPQKPPFQVAAPTPITAPTPTHTNTALQNLLPHLSSIPPALIAAVQHDHLVHNHAPRTLLTNHNTDLPTILAIITAPNHQLMLQQLTDQQQLTIARSTQDLILKAHTAHAAFITDSLHPDFDPTAKPNIERRRTLSTLNATLRATSTTLRTLFPTTHTPNTPNTKGNTNTAHKPPQPHWATLTPPHPNMQHPDDPTPNPNIAPNTKPTTWTTTLTPDQLAPIHDLPLLLSLFPPKR